jgi:DNA-binding PadR family transcriptional regulator
MEPRTTDDVSNTNNHCHCAAEADGGVRWFDLNNSKRDLLVEIYQMDHPSGQDIRGRMEAEHGEDVKHGRLYPNLNDLVDLGLLDKGEQNLRSNYYQITNDGQRLVEDTIRYFESIGVTNPDAADGGREQTAVDVKVLEGKVETLSKGLAATRESDEELELRADALSKGLSAVRESIDELKDDLEAERQERRLDPVDGGQE